MLGLCVLAVLVLTDRGWFAPDTRPELCIHILKWDVGALKLLGRGTTLFRLARWMGNKRITFKLDGAHPKGASHLEVVGHFVAEALLVRLGQVVHGEVEAGTGTQQVLQAAANGTRVGAMISFSLADEDIRAAARPSANQADWDHRYGTDRMWSGNPNGTLVNVAGALIVLVLSNIAGFAGYLFHGWVGDRIGRKLTIALGWTVGGVISILMLVLPTGTGLTITLYALTLFFLNGPYAAMLFYMGESFPGQLCGTGANVAHVMAPLGGIAGSALLSILLGAGMSMTVAALSAGSVFMLLQACLGVEVDGWANEIRVQRPKLPLGVDQVAVRGLQVGERTVDLLFQRSGARILAHAEGIDAGEVVCVIGVAPAAVIRSIGKAWSSA